MVDSYGKDETAWKVVGLSDPESVKGLLRLRTHFDLLYEDRKVTIFQTDIDLGEQLEDITCTYVWLDEVISKTILSEQQKTILSRYMDGKDTSEIAEEDCQTVRNINGILNTICKKISEEQHRQWKIWVHKNKLSTDFKECLSCGDSLPKTDEFFRMVGTDKNIYKNQCRKCESIGKKIPD